MTRTSGSRGQGSRGRGGLQATVYSRQSGQPESSQLGNSPEEDVDSEPARKQPRMTLGFGTGRVEGQLDSSKSSNSLEEDLGEGPARRQARVARTFGSRGRGGNKTSNQSRQGGQPGKGMKMQLISYVVKTKSKGKKNIVVLCTIPNLATVGTTKDDGKEKPAAIQVYDFSKGGTDISDQRCGSFTSATKIGRWPRKMLGYILDVTRVNAQSVYCLNTGKDPRTGTDSFRFGWDLAMSLVKPNMVVRLPTIKNRAIRTKMFIKPDNKEAQEDELELVNNQGDNMEDPGEQEEPPCQQDQQEEEQELQ